MKRLLLSLLLTVSAILLTGCNSGGPKVYSEPKIDKNLPVPKGIKQISDVTSVAFEWSRIDDPAVRGIAIYRGEAGSKLIRIGQADSRYATHYVDLGLKPGTEYSYRLATYSDAGFQSVGSDTVVTKTRNAPEPLAFVTKVDHLPRMAKLIFRPHPDTTINRYVIERRTPIKPEWEEIAVIEGRLNAEYIDTGLEDEKAYEYRVYAQRYDDIRSKPSKVVHISTKKLPEVIRNIGASNNLPRQIKVTWQQLPEENALKYNLYASKFLEGPYDLVTSIKNQGEYTHRIEKDGEVQYYKVTAVDKDGLESLMPEIPAQGATRAKPLTPSILKAEIRKGKPHIEWSSNDVNVKEFKIVRTMVEGFFSKKTVTFTDIKGKTFDDTSEGFQPNMDFIYTIIAIDKEGIESYPSEEVTLRYDLQEGPAN